MKHSLPVEPHDPSDKFIKNYIKDQPGYCECWEFETNNGELYRICMDKDGGEWMEEL